MELALSPDGTSVLPSPEAVTPPSNAPIRKITAETSVAANLVLGLFAVVGGVYLFNWIAKKTREGLSYLGIASEPT